MASEPLEPERSTLAGCPLCISFCKLYLRQQWRKPCATTHQRKHRHLWTTSFLICKVVRRSPWLEVLCGYSRIFDIHFFRNMSISMDKSGFLVSSKKAKHAFHTVLQEPPYRRKEFPALTSCIKDLGVDCTLEMLPQDQRAEKQT